MDGRIQVVLSVAKHQNFSKAADELHMSQPAVSQQVQSLELELGVKLFERNTKRVRLTKAGAIVVHYGETMAQAFASMKRLIDDLKYEVGGPMSIGASYTFGEYILPYVLASFCEKHPTVRPRIDITNTQHVVDLLVNDSIDLGIVEGLVTSNHVSSEAIANDRMVVIASSESRLVKEPSISPEDLRNTTWILREPGSGTRAAADDLLRVLGVTPLSILEFSSTQALKESVEAGLGVSVLSELTIQKELKLGTLRVLPFDYGRQVRPFYVVTRNSQFQPRVVQLFIEHMKEFVKHYAALN